MPESPARNFLGFSWGGGAKPTERLATPEELAEYGALGPDPETEAKILALFEEQLLQDLIKESPAPAATVVPGNPAAATENTMESSVEAKEPAEAPKLELFPGSLLKEITAEPAAGPMPHVFQVVVDNTAETAAQTPVEMVAESAPEPAPEDVAAAQALLAEDAEDLEMVTEPSAPNTERTIYWNLRKCWINTGAGWSPEEQKARKGICPART